MKRKIFFLVLVFISTFVWSGIVSSVEALSLPSIQLGVDDVEEPEQNDDYIWVVTPAGGYLATASSFKQIGPELSVPSGETPPCRVVTLEEFLQLQWSFQQPAGGAAMPASSWQPMV